MEWKKGEDPPKTAPGCWSKEVIVVTNYGDVFSMAFFGGVWQRPGRFNPGEKVEWWTEKPEGE